MSAREKAVAHNRMLRSNTQPSPRYVYKRSGPSDWRAYGGRRLKIQSETVMRSEY